MRDTIIIHNIHDKASREFVAAYGNRNDVTVLEDDGLNVRLAFPYISAFPTVVIPTPSYENTDENGTVTQIEGSIEYLRAPADWNEVQQRIDYWENKVPNWKQTDSRYQQ